VAVVKMNHATGARNLVRGWNDACKLIQESKKMKAHLLTPEHNRNHQHYQQMDNTKLVTKLVETYTALKTAYRTSVVPAANPPPVESKAEPTAAAPPTATAAAAISEAKKLDVNKVAAAAGGGAYDEEADPLNAPEVLEAVAQFKKKLEERDTSQKKRRMELVERKIKEIVVRVTKELKEEEQTRLERKVEQQVQVAVAGDKAGDSGKRGKSNLPAWMTRGTDTETGDAAAAAVPPPPPPTKEEEESSRKRKFVPSEANRDINTRKQRLDVVAEGTKSLSEIRAENEAADAAAAVTVTTKPTGPKPTKEQVLTISTTTFPLLLSPTHALYTSIRTHVTSCIVDYLGEEETTLIDFVMNQLCSMGGGEGGGGVGGATTMALLDEMKLVLDEDAEEFVWGLFCKFWELSFEEKK